MRFDILKSLIRQGAITLSVTGDCMRDSMAAGTTIRVEQKRLYFPGDVVAFRRFGDEIVSHRFLGYFPGRQGWRAITRADSAAREDTPVLIDHLLGHISQVAGVRYRPRLTERLGSLIHYFRAMTRRTVKLLINRRSQARSVT